jgi:hypothetical protein
MYHLRRRVSHPVSTGVVSLVTETTQGLNEIAAEHAECYQHSAAAKSSRPWAKRIYGIALLYHLIGLHRNALHS